MYLCAQLLRAQPIGHARIDISQMAFLRLGWSKRLRPLTSTQMMRRYPLKKSMHSPVRSIFMLVPLTAPCDKQSFGNIWSNGRILRHWKNSFRISCLESSVVGCLEENWFPKKGTDNLLSPLSQFLINSVITFDIHWLISKLGCMTQHTISKTLCRKLVSGKVLGAQMQQIFELWGDCKR